MAERGELPEACSGCYSDVVVDARVSTAHSVDVENSPETHGIHWSTSHLRSSRSVNHR